MEQTQRCEVQVGSGTPRGVVRMERGLAWEHGGQQNARARRQS